MTRRIVLPIGFIDYNSLATGRGGSAERLLRGRMKVQLSPPPTDQEITDMPVREALKIKALMDAAAFGQTETCVMLSKSADGMNVPFHFSLGKAIKYSSDFKIEELVIQAKNFGAVEDIVALDNELEQTAALLLIAEPILTPSSSAVTAEPVDVPHLVTLPSVLAKQVTVADGLWIMENVTRPFFSTEEGS